jgi:DNA-directed RNA polymerase specialized sigma subunit
MLARPTYVGSSLEAASEEVAVRPPTGDLEAAGAISALLGKVTASYVADVTASAERHGTEDGLITGIDSGKVRDAIMKLPEVERGVILQLYWEDRRLAEIGAGEERSESWASRVHTAALGLLREALS